MPQKRRLRIALARLVSFGIYQIGGLLGLG
jgi:hypothetical protein